jgi:hypothetical protein
MLKLPNKKIIEVLGKNNYSAYSTTVCAAVLKRK